jgi:signal transduction histidine kinase/CheY-like chemotaxis protein
MAFMPGENPFRELITRARGRAEIVLLYNQDLGYQLVSCNSTAALLFDMAEHSSSQEPLSWNDIAPALANYLSQALAGCSGEDSQTMAEFAATGTPPTRYAVELFYAVENRLNGASTRHWYYFCFRDKNPLAGDMKSAIDSGHLETIGELATGVAHDFNNLIMGMQANAEALLSNEALRESDRGYLVNIIRACSTGTSLTRSLLGYAKRQPLDMVDFNLVDFVNDVSNIARLSLGTKHSVILSPELQSGQKPIMVYGCYSSLSHCLINLIKNSREAMPKGGNVELIWQGTQDEACLTVKDHGCGIADADLQRVFEPFYSTKKTGSGLGMSMVQGIMSQHLGRVEVQSKVGEGTSVSLKWPRPPITSVTIAPDQRRSIVSLKEAMQSSSGADGVPQFAFVIDDDDLVRDGVKGLLEHLGYKVEAFSGGQQALQALNVRSIPQLILIDHNMPNMTGSEFVRYWFEELPEIYRNSNSLIVLCSGDPPSAFTDFMEKYKDENVGLLQKPFSLATLSKKLTNIKGVRTITTLLPAQG